MHWRAHKEGDADSKHHLTSYAERQNLTIRMCRFEDYMHMVALYAIWYNSVKQHKTLKGLCPAIASGISQTLWGMTDLAGTVDAAAPRLGKRGLYEKRTA